MANQSVSAESSDLIKRAKALKHEIGNKTVTLEGQQYTGNGLGETCTKRVTADELVESTRRAWLAAVAARDALREETDSVFSALKKYVQATYGASSQKVAEFGYKPAEAIVKSAEVKAQAVVKLRATRSARHTMGSQQRKSVKGPTSSSPTLVQPSRVVSSS